MCSKEDENDSQSSDNLQDEHTDQYEYEEEVMSSSPFGDLGAINESFPSKIGFLFKRK